MPIPFLNLSIVGGASDIIVVYGEDEKYRSTPFTVRFGLLKCISTRNKIVKIYINDIPTNLYMNLDETGLCYFETNSVCSVIELILYIYNIFHLYRIQ